MLKHVVKAKIFDQVFRAVDVVIGILEIGLNDERRGVSSLGCRGVV